MEKQIIELQKIESFKLKDIFECGQCFRWEEKQDKSYIGVVKKNVIKITEQEGSITFESKGQDDLELLIKDYFDLERDYTKIKRQLEKIDPFMKESISFGEGIRILNQDLWETILSFIISANNHIPRIKSIIERLSEAYGDPIEFEGKRYYTFPTLKQLEKVTIQEYRKLGLGFRDVRICETVQRIKEKKVVLEQLYEEDTKTAREKLLLLSGVGPKVADCILLFSDLKRLDVFPIDVWVRRVMSELYLNQDEKEVSKKEILEIADQKFGPLQGIAQQYLFYWRRQQKRSII